MSNQKPPASGVEKAAALLEDFDPEGGGSVELVEHFLSALKLLPPNSSEGLAVISGLASGLQLYIVNELAVRTEGLKALLFKLVGEEAIVEALKLTKDAGANDEPFVA